MKRRFFFAVMAVAMMVSCGTDNKENKGEADVAAQGAEASATSAADEVEATPPTDTPVVAGDIVFIDPSYLSGSSKIYQTEGVVFESNFLAFQDKVQRTQTSWQNKEQSFANEAQKIQSDYEKGMITGITAQQKSEDVQRRYAEFQKSMEAEAKKLADEEARVIEEQQVLDNRFAKLVELAVKSVNADGRYKMVVRKEVVVDADESLNISALVLAEMDRLYDEGALN